MADPITELLTRALTDAGACVRVQVPSVGTVAGGLRYESIAHLAAVAAEKLRDAGHVVGDTERAEPTQDEMAEGHLFEISLRSWGVSRVVGDPTYHQDNWTLPPYPVQVRAWSLVEALRKAAALPLDAWFAQELEEADRG